MRDERNKALQKLGEEAVCEKLGIVRQRLRNAMAKDEPIPARWYWPLVQLGTRRVRIKTEWFAWAESKKEENE